MDTARLFQTGRSQAVRLRLDRFQKVDVHAHLQRVADLGQFDGHVARFLTSFSGWEVEKVAITPSLDAEGRTATGRSHGGLAAMTTRPKLDA